MVKVFVFEVEDIDADAWRTEVAVVAWRRRAALKKIRDAELRKKLIHRDGQPVRTHDLVEFGGAFVRWDPILRRRLHESGWTAWETVPMRSSRLRRRVAPVALAVGLMVGTAVGWIDARDRQSDPDRFTADITLPCFAASEVEFSPFRVSITEEPWQALMITTTASMTIQEVDPYWRNTTDLDLLGDCILYNRSDFQALDGDNLMLRGAGVLGEPTYKWTPSQRQLSVWFEEQSVNYGFGHAPIAREDTTQGAVDAYQDGRTFVVQIDPCPQPSERLACSSFRSGRIEVVVPSDLPASGPDHLLYEPLPAVVASNNGSTVLTWLVEDVPGTISVRVVLPLDVAVQNYLYRGGTMEVDIPYVSVSVGPFALIYIPTIVVFVVGLIAVRTYTPRHPAKRYLRRLILLFALLGLMQSISVQPFEPWNAMIAALLWTAILVLLSWTWLAGVGATLGLVVAIFGAVSQQTAVLSIGVLSLVVMGLLAIGRRLADAAKILPSRETQPLGSRLSRRPGRLGPSIITMSLFGVLLGLGALAGSVLGEQVASLPAFNVAMIVSLIASNSSIVLLTISSNSSVVLLAISGLLLIGAVAGVITRDDGIVPLPRTQVALAYLLAVVAPPVAIVWAGIGLPTWIITLVLLILLLKTSRGHPATSPGDSSTDLRASASRNSRSDEESLNPRSRLLLAEAVHRELAMNQLGELDAKVSSGDAKMADLERAYEATVGRHPTDVTSSFLERGVHGQWFRNAQLSSWVGGLVALLPLAGFVWSVAQTAPDRLGHNGLLYLILGIVSQYARWVVAAFVLGALYAILPGRLGPIKGASLAGIWSLAALVAELVSRWITGDSSDNWIYLSLQMFLFLIATGVLFDLLTVIAAGGTYRRLIDVYRVSTLRRRFAYIGPVLLAVAALIQQVSAGANVDAAREVINSITRLLGG